jgi:hypothetical protein
MVIKKLIAISVVFALVAGAAFAVDVGGAVIGAVKVVDKQGGADDAALFSGGLGRVRLEGSGEADIGIGTIGGWLRVDGTWSASLDPVTLAAYAMAAAAYETAYDAWETAGKPTTGPTVTALESAKEDLDDAAGAYSGVGLSIFSGLAWWQPIEQLRIQIGANPDGHYDTSHIGRYGFYAQANELGMVNGDGNWGATSYDKGVFGGGFGFNHFALIITPMDGVTVNVAIPLNGGPKAGDVFKSALFQVNYAADFGAIHITYVGGGAKTNGSFFGSAYLSSLVEGLQLELGLGFTAVKSGADKPPLGIALGARYDVSEQFGVKLRSIFEIPMQSGGKVAVRVDVLPFYAINENVTAYFDAGIYLTGASSQFAYHFNPYVRIGSEWGPGFYAGITMNNGGGAKGEKVNFGIPIGIIATF